MDCSTFCKKWTNEVPTLLRVFAGIIFLHAGIGKIMGGAANFAGMIGFMPLPLFFAWLVIITETVGGLFLILGLWTRWVSIPLGIVMAVAAGTMWITAGFGAAYAPILGFAICKALFVLGNGDCSLEKAAFGKEC
jgi:putative oxidoreductase